MTFYRKSLTLGMLLFACLSTGHVEARESVKAVKARVRFIATSWVLRTIWGRNEDTYLAEISVQSASAPFLVRLIDEYPNEWPSLSRDVLTASEGSTMRIRRGTQYEIPFEHVALRTAPGDLMAILPERLSYQPKLNRPPQQDEILPCYRIVRK